MSRSILECIPEINPFTSFPTNESHHPTNSQKLKPKKVSKGLMAFINTVGFFHLKGHTGECYLKKDNWNAWLVKHGGKPVSYRQFKTYIKQASDLELILKHRKFGSRRKEYAYVLTQKGIDLYLEKLPLESKKTSPRNTKNFPSLKVLKVLKNGHEEISPVTKLSKEQEDLRNHIVKEGNVYNKLATDLVDVYGFEQTKHFWNIACHSGPRNLGAYFRKLILDKGKPIKTFEQLLKERGITREEADRSMKL